MAIQVNDDSLATTTLPDVGTGLHLSFTSARRIME